MTSPSPDNGNSQDQSLQEQSSQILSCRFFKPHSALFNPQAHCRLWLIAGFGLLADLLTKSWALRVIGNPAEMNYSELKPIEIIDGYVRLITVLNPGASWGIASGRTSLLLIGSAIAMVFMFWLFVSLHPKQWVAQMALGMLLGGALGNTYDRVFNDGKVVDFIDINLSFWPANPWPAFNVADSLLCVGVGILLISMLFKQKEASES